MASILLQRHLGSFRPIDADGVDYLATVKGGEILRADMKRMRNPRQHRLYWAAIGLCFQHQETYATRDQLHSAIKVWLGYCDEFEGPNGRLISIPKSIKFGNMSQEAWTEFFEAFIKLICERIIPNTDDAELRAELDAMVGGGDNG